MEDKWKIIFAQIEKEYLHEVDKKNSWGKTELFLLWITVKSKILANNV